MRRYIASLLLNACYDDESRYIRYMRNFNDTQIIIMAGGVGSHFWPMSPPDYPKQFIDVMGVGRSLIQLTVDRLKPISPVENMWVVTNEKYIRIVKGKSPLVRMAVPI